MQAAFQTKQLRVVCQLDSGPPWDPMTMTLDNTWNLLPQTWPSLWDPMTPYFLRTKAAKSLTNFMNNPGRIYTCGIAVKIPNPISMDNLSNTEVFVFVTRNFLRSFSIRNEEGTRVFRKYAQNTYFRKIGF